MPRLPSISGPELIKILEKKGYTLMRTKGSHVRLYPPDYSLDLKKVTVPLHKRLKIGTLVSIMRDASLRPDDLK